MSDLVKPGRRAARRAETESRLVNAATELFVANGYAATTLAAIADAAGVAHRTVYARFKTKADLLQRCFDIAIGGGEGAAIDDRDWVRAAMSAPTVEARITAMATATAALMDRCGPLLGVAQQAESLEPSIAARAQAARLDTQRVVETFWRTMASDRLLPRTVDIDWLAVTGALAAQADTYLTAARTLDWDGQTFGAWLETTWLRLVTAAGNRR